MKSIKLNRLIILLFIAIGSFSSQTTGSNVQNIANDIFGSFEKIVGKLTDVLVQNINQNKSEASYQASSKVKRQIASNPNSILKQQAKIGNFYKKMYFGKRETNLGGIEQLDMIKETIGQKFNATIREYTSEFKALSNEFIDRTKELANEYKKRYKEIVLEQFKLIDQLKEKN